ncbi:MAG: hypothetical protein WB729_11270 [Candidatus Sulfotelmatobacter sp.]
MRLSRAEAESVIAEWAHRQRSEQIRTMAETGPKPTYHRITTNLNDPGAVVTIKGPLGPRAIEAISDREDPVRFLFFVDRNPGANWEHACQYVFVHNSKRLTIIEATAPPTTLGQSKLKRLKQVFPHDITNRGAEKNTSRDKRSKRTRSSKGAGTE